jgi:ATP-dependent Clp protease protease subunit
METVKNYIPNPTVIEQTARGERQYDVYSRLLLDRIIFLGTEVSSVSANLIIAQMLFLEQADPDAPIHFYINSPGGSVYDGLGIYDMMQYISCPVYTYCIGMAASMGSVLLAGGTKGHRYAMAHARIMIHQPSGGARGQSSDIQIQAEEILTLRDQLYRVYEMHNTVGKTAADFIQLCDRDNYMTSQQAIELGLIDHVIVPKKKV